MADTRVTGKTLSYTHNSVEQNILNLSTDFSYATENKTNSGTTGDGIETLGLRSTFTYDIEAYLFDGSGNEITGDTLSITIGGSTVRCISIDYDKQYDTADATTCASTPGVTEVLGTRHTSTTTVVAGMYKETADRLLPGGTADTAVVLTFKTGFTVTGNCLVVSQTDTSDANAGNFVEITLTLNWQDSPVEVGVVGDFVMNTPTPFVITYDTGTSTNKAVSGNCLVLGRTISANVNEGTRVTYNCQATDAIAKTVASDA